MLQRKPEIDLAHKVEIKEALAQKGFVIFAGADFTMGIETRQALDALVASFDDLPPDLQDPTGRRRRRYSKFFYLPWVDVLHEQPPVLDNNGTLIVEYFQPLSYNSKDGGKRRPFCPLHPVTRSNRALHELIKFDYWSIPPRNGWEGMPISVGVHQISYAPDSRGSAQSSPNKLHRDGEPYTFVHNMLRRNVTGGVNYVARPECVGFQPHSLDHDKILAKITLEALLDSLAFDDTAVCHHADEVFCDKGDQKARRNVFLIDLAPNMPQLS